MHYLSARFAVLAAAMTFTLAPLGQAAWASGDKPVAAGSMIDRNSIVPPSADSPAVANVTLVRYTKTLLGKAVEYNLPPACTEVEAGTWTVTAAPTYGKVTFGPVTGDLTNGDCPGTPFTFAAIYYKWTAHNNKTISDTISDTFNATRATSDGRFNIPVTFNITVPEVRPASETTAFVDWDPKIPTIGRWRQTLVPPADDAKFDFSGQSVEENDAPGTHLDTCWFLGSDIGAAISINGGTMATVQANNVWEFDSVGRTPRAVAYYRSAHVVEGVKKPPRAPCENHFPQQMFINTNPGSLTFHPYAGVNALGAKIGTATVTSIRAGSEMTKAWP